MNELKLNKGLYFLNRINIAIKAFADIADISIREEEKYYLCDFSNCSYDLETTMMEFENYIIDLSNKRG